MEALSADENFNNVYRQTFREVSAYVISHIGKPNDTEDVLQNVYLSFYKRILKKGKIPDDDCTAYLKTAAKHEIYKYYSFRKIKASDISLDDEDGEIYESLIADDSFDETLCNSIFLEDVWLFVRSSDTDTYRIFLLKYVHGYTLCEIADILDLPIHMVNNKLYRTIKDIRDKFILKESVSRKRNEIYTTSFNQRK